jgi:hypothetical protein
LYAENQLDAIKEALLNFQQTNDTKAALGVALTYSSGQVCSVMSASLLIQTDTNNSSQSSLGLFIMGPILRKYSMISWQSPLPGGMSQRHHSLTLFRVWALSARMATFG